MGKREPAKRGVDFARRHRLELVQHRQLNPFDIDKELALEMPHEGQGQFIEAAAEEADSQSISLTERGLPAIVQRGAKHQRRRLDAEPELLAKGRQLDAPTRSYEARAAPAKLQGASRHGERRL